MAEVTIPSFEDVIKAGFGGLLGLMSAGIVQIPKAVAMALFGKAGAIGSAAADGLLTTWAIYDLVTKPDKDAFWKGVEGGFAFAEIIATLIALYNAVKE